MASWAHRLRVRILVSALATLALLSVGEAAQAACYGAGQALPAQVVSRFISDPARLLTQFPNGGPQMISLIRDLVASDPGTLPLIVDLNPKANADQTQAIGTGLGQAALVCARTAQAFANEIRQMIVATNNQPLTQAFGAVMGDQYLGAAGPSVGGGGAGATGQTGPTGGTVAGGASLNLTTTVPTTPSNVFTMSLSFTPGTPGVVNTGSTAGSGGQGGSGLPTAPGGTGGSGGSGGSNSPGSPGAPSSSLSPSANVLKSTSPSTP
jgi:hypothetical protein